VEILGRAVGGKPGYGGGARGWGSREEQARGMGGHTVMVVGPHLHPMCLEQHLCDVESHLCEGGTL
jgi:hypothetical protein